MTASDGAWVLVWPSGYPDQAKVDAIYGRLTDAGKAAFLSKLAATPSDRLADVIDRWYESMRFATHPRRAAADARLADAIHSEAPATYPVFMDELRAAWARHDAASGG